MRKGRTPAMVFRGIAETYRVSWRNVGAPHGAGSWLVSLGRPLRVLAYPGAHRRLVGLPIYQEFGLSVFREDLFHHLSHRHYLRRGLTVQQRIRYVLEHYSFETRQWNERYRQAVYAGSGVELWRQEVAGVAFTIRLRVAERTAPEGDLRLSLLVDDLPLHHINLTWLTSPQDGGTVLPFVGRSQGCAHYHPEAMALFEKCFPQNSPAYFCFAAVPGIARVVGAPGIRGVRGHEQICADKVEDPTQFQRIYCRFWQTMGGSDDGGMGIFIPLPTHNKPLHQLSASHRKRARKRRKHWAAIEAATVATLIPYLSSSHSRTTPDSMHNLGDDPDDASGQIVAAG